MAVENPVETRKLIGGRVAVVRNGKVVRWLGAATVDSDEDVAIDDTQLIDDREQDTSGAMAVECAILDRQRMEHELGPAEPGSLREMGVYDLKEASAWVRANPLTWVVDDMFPTRAVNVVAADPKIGKSVLMRTLAIAVATGNPFLGRKTMQGPVLYYCLEDHLHEFMYAMDKLDLNFDEVPIRLVQQLDAQYVGNGGLSHLQETWNRYVEKGLETPKMVLVDMGMQLMNVSDVNDYSQVSNALLAFSRFATLHDVTVIVTHHDRKTSQALQGKTRTKHPSEMLGSTAWFGRSYTSLMMWKDHESQTRYVSTVQRGMSIEHRGLRERDMPQTALSYDPNLAIYLSGPEEDLSDGKKSQVAPPTEDYKRGMVVAAVNYFLTNYPDLPATRELICEKACLALRYYRANFEMEVTLGNLTASGRGVRNSPRTYDVVDTQETREWVENVVLPVEDKTSAAYKEYMAALKEEKPTKSRGKPAKHAKSAAAARFQQASTALNSIASK